MVLVLVLVMLMVLLLLLLTMMLLLLRRLVLLMGIRRGIPRSMRASIWSSRGALGWCGCRGGGVRVRVREGV
jgi:NhaP-type Na+/H+ or K+/H+ antiporter